MGSRLLGGHVFSMLEGSTGRASFWAPSREAHRWMTVDTDRKQGVRNFDDLRNRILVNPQFGAKLYDVLKPGTTVVVTDLPAARRAQANFPVLGN